MPKKLLLDDLPAPDYQLIGISCHMPEYRLIHYLNKEIHIDLSKNKDFAISITKADRRFNHSFFYYQEPDYQTIFCFLTNRTSENILVPALRNLDFLLILFDDFGRYDVNGLISDIRALPNVLMSNIVHTSGIKNFDNFVYQLEEHVTMLSSKREPKLIGI